MLRPLPDNPTPEALKARAELPLTVARALLMIVKALIKAYALPIRLKDD